jgi:hypothetical protein
MYSVPVCDEIVNATPGILAKPAARSAPKKRIRRAGLSMERHPRSSRAPVRSSDSSRATERSARASVPLTGPNARARRERPGDHGGDYRCHQEVQAFGEVTMPSTTAAPAAQPTMLAGTRQRIPGIAWNGRRSLVHT